MIEFVTRGQVPYNRPELYVVRPGDTQFDEFLRRNDYIAVIGPRVSGKTSLLVRKYHDLRARQRTLPVYVNLSLLSKLDGPAWYERLYRSIIEGVRVGGVVSPISTFPITNELDVRDALLDALEAELKSRILVIMLDDVETIPKPLLTPIMAMIREMFSSREMVPAFKRAVWVLSGCFLPDDLIDDPSISPFRIAERVHLQDADLAGVAQLVKLIEGPAPGAKDVPTESTDLPGHIYAWTGGDVYLTQRLCQLIQAQPRRSNAAVDDLVTHTLIEDGIFGRVVRSVETNKPLAKLLTGIASGDTPVRFTRLQRTIADAWLAGIIREDGEGYCTIRNAVYHLVLHGLDPATVSRPLPTHHKTPATGSAIVSPRRLRGRYQLESMLGRGGMAQVFRAHDEQTGKTVAIKQLLVELSDDRNTLERFQREAASLRALNHPNIVHFYDLFQEEGHRFMVIEYVRGGSLSNLMHREGRSLSAKVALAIMTGVIDGLDHAHRHGIIHRDVKPGNVLLTPEYVPRLADFGVARLLRENRMTETGLVVGTIPYMSPEVCSGDDASPASDLWSAGVMFFEMLTGYLPFNGPNPAAIIHAIMTAPLPDLRAARPDIAPGLLAVITRLLTRELAARYTDAAVVARALRALRL